MIDDDHYIANARNAHIDTSGFERDVLNLLSHWDSSSSAEILENIYNLVFSKTNVAPEEPPDNQLICRYLTPGKLIKFIDSKCINFPVATQFNDQWECRIPEDYDHAVLRAMGNLEISATSWYQLVKSKASEWNVSCWTQLDDDIDDHLMWNAYAGGPKGVGITVRYNKLKETIAKEAEKLDVDGQLQSGRTNYKSVSLLPFNKHYMFRNEKEIRFAFRGFQSGPYSVSVGEIFDLFGLRISPAATQEHHDMVRNLWLRYGGEDRIQWPA